MKPWAPTGRRRILALFVAGVALPSVALAYLAFRGIRNERAMEAQRLTEAHRLAALHAAEAVETHLSTLEADLRGTLADRPNPGSDPPGVAGNDRARLEEFRGRHPVVEAVFEVGPSGAVRVRAPPLLYRDQVVASSPGPDPPAAVLAGLRAGERNEFALGRLEAALAEYRGALTRATDSGRAPVLLAMARVQRKTGRIRDALESWERIRDEAGELRLSGGAPLAAVAHLEIAELLLADGDSTAAARSYLGLLEGLLGATWPLDRSQFDFLCDRVEAGLAPLLPQVSETAGRLAAVPSSFAGLAAREAALRDRTERLVAFEGAAGRELGTSDLEAGDGGSGSTRTAAAGAGRPPPTRRWVLTSSGRSWLVSMVPDRAEDWRGGLLLYPDRIRDGVVLPVLTSADDDSPLAWRLLERDGRVLAEAGNAGTASPTLTATFPGGFPPWLLELYRPSESAYRQVLGSSRSVYLYMFLLIAGILGFGLVLTVRAVGHELAIARLRSDFVSTVSHEFRSPLTSIRQLAEMLQRDRVPSEARRQRYYDILVEQSARLSALVTNILDMARIEEGRAELRLERVDPGPLLRELVAQTRQRTVPDGFEIELRTSDDLPPVRGDPEAMEHAFSNLLDNAVRYSGASRRVEVLATAEAAGTEVAVSFRDHGIGILASELDRVFDRFFRGSARPGSVPGSGLGLTLVREVVTAHGGRVDVESEPGCGSTFTIRLPVWRGRTTEEDGSRAAPGSPVPPEPQGPHESSVPRRPQGPESQERGGPGGSHELTDGEEPTWRES